MKNGGAPIEILLSSGGPAFPMALREAHGLRLDTAALSIVHFRMNILSAERKRKNRELSYGDCGEGDAQGERRTAEYRTLKVEYRRSPPLPSRAVAPALCRRSLLVPAGRLRSGQGGASRLNDCGESLGVVKGNFR